MRQRLSNGVLVGAILYIHLEVVGGLSTLHRRNKLHRNDEVRVPKSDRRSFRNDVLDNGLKVLAVHDPDAAKAGFALAVSAGSFYEPEKLPGLAHFCEHLVFLGSEKYPDESAFDEFVAKNDGSSNAYTADERTVFYNEVGQQGLDEGMDRFAQFFIAPLFKDELVVRELNAVNSEHTKNIPYQDMRLWETIRSTAGQASVLGRFTTGTVKSLNHGNTQTIKALKKYHKKNYCAPRMNLVIVSNFTIEEQMNLARTHFAAVPDGSDTECTNYPADFSDDPGFTNAEQLGRFVQIKANSVPQLWLMFPMAPTANRYTAQPVSVLEYLLGYEGKNSLRSKLLKAGLISELYVEIDESSAGTLAFIMYDLTPHGVSQQKAVHKLTFAYLKKLQTLRKQDQAGLDSIYETMKQMSAVSFDYQQSDGSLMDVVSALAEATQLYEPEDTLSGSVLIDKTDNDLVTTMIGYLTPDNVNAALATPDFQLNNTNAFNEYYDMHYINKEAPQWMRDAWDASAEDAVGIDFPPELKFVPSNLELLDHQEKSDSPALLNSSETGTSVWWNGLGSFRIPKENFNAKVSVHKKMFQTARFDALRQLHVELCSQALEEPTEDMAYCGLGWNLEATPEGYAMSVSGYNQYAPDVVEMVAKRFANPFKSDDVNFTRAKERLLMELQDVSAWMPYEHASGVMTSVSTNSGFTQAQIAHEMQNISQTDMEAYLADLKKTGARIEVLSTGNRQKDGALNMTDGLVQKLEFDNLLDEVDVARDQVVQVKSGTEVQVKMKNPIPGDSDSAIINAYQFGVPDVADRVKMLMIGQMIAQPIYDTLRTQQQLGYVVSGSVASRLSTMELRVVVQGSKEGPEEVDGRIEAVLESFGTDLQSLSHNDFLDWKDSARSMLGENDMNQDQENDRLWSAVTNGHCFNFREKALSYLDAMNSSDELKQTYRQLRESPRKVSVRLYGEGTKDKSDKKGGAKLLQIDADDRTGYEDKSMLDLLSVDVNEWSGQATPTSTNFIAGKGGKQAKQAKPDTKRHNDKQVLKGDAEGAPLSLYRVASSVATKRLLYKDIVKVDGDDIEVKAKINSRDEFWSPDRICEMHSAEDKTGNPSP